MNSTCHSYCSIQSIDTSALWTVLLPVHCARFFFYIKQVVTLRRQLHAESVVFGLEK